MVSLPDGEKISKISLFVLVQLRNVTDRQTDGHRVTAIAALCIASHGNKTSKFRTANKAADPPPVRLWHRQHNGNNDCEQQIPDIALCL